VIKLCNNLLECTRARAHYLLLISYFEPIDPSIDPRFPGPYSSYILLRLLFLVLLRFRVLLFLGLHLIQLRLGVLLLLGVTVLLLLLGVLLLLRLLLFILLRLRVLLPVFLHTSFIVLFRPPFLVRTACCTRI
jgi:hypothetical protein